MKSCATSTWRESRPASRCSDIGDCKPAAYDAAPPCQVPRLVHQPGISAVRRIYSLRHVSDHQRCWIEGTGREASHTANGCFGYVGLRIGPWCSGLGSAKSIPSVF